MSDSMPRFKVFFEVHQCLHHCGNEQVHKEIQISNLRSVINELNKRFLKFTFHGKNKFIDQSMISYFANHGSWQRINNKPIGGGHNIWLLSEAYGYVAQFQPCQGVKKGK